MNLFDYYQSYQKYFWVWEEDANVLAVTGGSTIGFREQVEEILMGIAENGLPPFGSFLLTMIATNKTMDDPVENVASIIKAFQQQETIAHYKEPIDEAFAFLKLLQTIPGEYTIGKRRQILLQTIFADSHNRLNVPTSKGIAAGLKNNAQGRTRLMKPKELNAHVFYKDFRTVALMLRKFPTAQSVIDAMGDLPELSESELPLLEDQAAKEKTYKDFVEELTDNMKTFHAGALIRPIWAGFKVPFFNAHPSEQPLGGVSDLSNKGDFDKLLISEFANDDLLFMSRIANNEALYLHREMPPVKDQVHRNILIDISLKTWGTPKILAHAAYIAIARHPKSLSGTRAFVLGNDYTPVSCDNIGAIIDGLEKVDAALHASKGLAAFLEANKHDKQLELFFITTADAIKYPDVQKLLSLHYSLFKYIITTDAEGGINFYRRKNNVQKHLQTIRLPLEKLWTKKAIESHKKSPIAAPVTAPSFIPVLMPTPAEIRKTIPFEEEVYIVANKCLLRRTLAQNQKARKGWQLILRNVPANSHYELGKTENGETMFLSFNPRNKELSITNLDTLQHAKTSFEYWSGKRYPEFLSNKYDGFTYFVKNPDTFTLKPDFNSGNITVAEQGVASGIFAINYTARQKEINDFLVPFFNNGVLKNVRDVFIDESECLVFNKHQLICNDRQIGFYAKSAHVKHIRSERHTQTGSFIFKDGSKIVIDPCGFATLISSNQEIPNSFIILIMDTLPGMATSADFAGNDFFYNSDLAEVNVTISSAGGQPLNAIRILKEHYATMGLKEAKEIVDSVPQTILTKINYQEALKMIEKLKTIGSVARISNSNNQPQRVIAVNSFYQKNIATFIKYIIDYAPAG